MKSFILLVVLLGLALGVQHQSLSQAKQACVCKNWPGPDTASGFPNCTEWGFDDSWANVIMTYDNDQDGIISRQEYYPLSVDACVHECGYYDQDAADQIDLMFDLICDRDLSDGHGYNGFSYTDLNLNGRNICP